MYSTLIEGRARFGVPDSLHNIFNATMNVAMLPFALNALGDSGPSVNDRSQEDSKTDADDPFVSYHDP